MGKTVIVSAARTPFGKFGGALKEVKAAELGGIAIKEAIKRAAISESEAEGAVMGMVVQAGAGQIPHGRLQDMPGFRGPFRLKPLIRSVHQGSGPLPSVIK